MANLAYSTEIQNRVAYALFTSAYSALATEQKNAIDGASAADPPTSGRAVDAFLTIKKMGQWWELTDSTTVSDAAQAWLVAEIVFLVSLTQRPERIQDFKDARDRAMNEYLDTITTTTITTGYGADVFTLSLQSCRYYVLRRVAGTNRKMLISVTPEELDASTTWCLNWLWNKAAWLFRRRLVTITVTTSGSPAGSSPTINLVSGETFDKVSSQRLYYSTFTPNFVSMIGGDAMSALKADTTIAAAMPQYFRIERSGQTQSWLFHPYPDQTYTLTGEVLIRLPGTTTPGVPDSATDTVPFSKIPHEFIHPFKELVLGHVMRNRGVSDEVWNKAVEEIERFAPIYLDQGGPDLDGAVRDVYHDGSSQQSITQIGYGYGQYGIGGAI